MYAIIASGKTLIVNSQSELNKTLMIYPFAKYNYFDNEARALEWVRQNQRGIYSSRPQQYGSTSSSGYIEVSYFIDGKNVYYNLDLKKFGATRILPDLDANILVDNRADIIKIKVENTVLNSNLISHHCIAIQRLLNIVGEFVDVNFLLPDMSVYIALTSYKGKDITIKRVQDYITTRIGGVSYTVKEYR